LHGHLVRHSISSGALGGWRLPAHHRPLCRWKMLEALVPRPPPWRPRSSRPFLSRLGSMTGFHQDHIAIVGCGRRIMLSPFTVRAKGAGIEQGLGDRAAPGLSSKEAPPSRQPATCPNMGMPWRMATQQLQGAGLALRPVNQPFCCRWAQAALDRAPASAKPSPPSSGGSRGHVGDGFSMLTGPATR